MRNGGRAAAAAVTAGYSERSADNIAHVLMRKPTVYQELMRQLPNAIGLNAVPALAVVSRLMSSAKSDYVKLEAAKDLLDRAGFSPPQRVDHRLDTQLTVSLNLGGSKTVGMDSVTHPHLRNSSQELDLLATPVEISPPIVKNTTFPPEDGE
jgi:phage terminase small subunit